ncbi:MAG: helix-turn-helix domain-containing protein [Saprospiraceae bacterium]
MATPFVNFAQFSPIPALRNYIRYCWSIEADMNIACKQKERFLPDGHLELIIDLGDPVLHIYDDQTYVRPESFIAGLHENSFHIKAIGQQQLKAIGIILKPWAVSCFLKMSLHELKGQAIALEDIFGKEANLLLEQIKALPTTPEKLYHFQIFLLHRMQAPSTEQFILKKLLQSIYHRKGNIKVKDLAQQVYFSERKLLRVFQRYLGLSPKSFARLIRMEEAVKAYKMQPQKNLTDISYDLGYFDQSHFIHDFQKIAGISPKQYFLELNTLDDQFLDHEAISA